MPVRLRLTLLFSALVMCILFIVCGDIYYFSYSARIKTIKTRLTNRAITTAKLLAQKETFNYELVKKIDLLTTVSLKNKTVQVYDQHDTRIYSYSDIPGDTLHLTGEQLDRTRNDGKSFFNIADKEAISYYYRDSTINLVVISAGEDIDGKRALHSLFKILLSGFFIGSALVIAAGYFFSKRILLPVNKIAADVEDISAQNLARRIETGQSKDEWYNLTNTLNGLLNRLQDSFELQRRFISNASHELITPLTAISSQLEVSLQKSRETEEYRQVMQSIYQDVRQMSRLIQTLLEFAKASGNAGGLEINLVRIDEIILEMPSEITKMNPSFSVSIEFDKLPENEKNLLVFGNEALLSMAIKNVVSNACKYSKDQQAEILLSTMEKSIKINIIDHGKGIPQAELKNIFQPFYRIDEKETGKGFGLGLSLAQKIIILHKGTIEVSSKLDSGTVFEISLPKANALS